MEVFCIARIKKCSSIPSNPFLILQWNSHYQIEPLVIRSIGNIIYEFCEIGARQYGEKVPNWRDNSLMRQLIWTYSFTYPKVVKDIQHPYDAITTLLLRHGPLYLFSFPQIKKTLRWQIYSFIPSIHYGVIRPFNEDAWIAVVINTTKECRLNDELVVKKLSIYIYFLFQCEMYACKYEFML